MHLRRIAVLAAVVVLGGACATPSPATDVVLVSRPDSAAAKTLPVELVSATKDWLIPAQDWSTVKTCCGIVEGVVSLENGESPRGTEVRLDTGNGWYCVKVDGDGRFELTELCPSDTYHVCVRAPGGNEVCRMLDRGPHITGVAITLPRERP